MGVSSFNAKRKLEFGMVCDTDTDEKKNEQSSYGPLAWSGYLVHTLFMTSADLTIGQAITFKPYSWKTTKASPVGAKVWTVSKGVVVKRNAKTVSVSVQVEDGAPWPTLVQVPYESF